MRASAHNELCLGLCRYLMEVSVILFRCVTERRGTTRVASSATHAVSHRDRTSPGSNPQTPTQRKFLPPTKDTLPFAAGVKVLSQDGKSVSVSTNPVVAVRYMSEGTVKRNGPTGRRSLIGTSSTSGPLVFERRF